MIHVNLLSTDGACISHLISFKLTDIIQRVRMKFVICYIEILSGNWPEYLFIVYFFPFRSSNFEINDGKVQPTLLLFLPD